MVGHKVCPWNLQMQSWAQSKQQPGQFTGSTGAQIMSQAELSSGFQAWARKVLFFTVHFLSTYFLFFFGNYQKTTLFCFLLIPTHAFYEFSGKNTPEASFASVCSAGTNHFCLLCLKWILWLFP